MMAPLTGFRRWLSPTAQLRANSWMLMTGSFGMLASTLPVQWLMPVMGWRPLFWGLAVAGRASMAVIAWKVPAWQVAPGAAGRHARAVMRKSGSTPTSAGCRRSGSSITAA